MNGKTVSRAKTLLKVDTEYLRRTIPVQVEAMPEDCKQIYSDSVTSLKMMSR